MAEKKTYDELWAEVVAMEPGEARRIDLTEYQKEVRHYFHFMSDYVQNAYQSLNDRAFALESETLNMQLHALLIAHGEPPSDVKRMDWYARTNMARALGLLRENEAAAMHGVRKVRNAFSHDTTLVSFEDEEVRPLVEGLSTDPSGQVSLRTKFFAVFFWMACHLNTLLAR
jgi:hypothetical protein